MRKSDAGREVSLECPHCGGKTPVAAVDLVEGRSVECGRCAGETVVTRAEGDEGPDGWILGLPPEEEEDG